MCELLLDFLGLFVSLILFMNESLLVLSYGQTLIYHLLKLLFQIEYNDRVHTSTLKAKPVLPVAIKSNADDNEDDVDIDAI